MSLHLGMRVGHDVYIDQAQFVVVNIAGDRLSFELQRISPQTGLPMSVSVIGSEWVTILPDVKVCCGDAHQRDKGIRPIVNMLIDAPQSIRIVRGNLYRNKLGGMK